MNKELSFRKVNQRSLSQYSLIYKTKMISKIFKEL